MSNLLADLLVVGAVVDLAALVAAVMIATAAVPVAMAMLIGKHSLCVHFSIAK